MLLAFKNLQSLSLIGQLRQISFSFRSLVAREPRLWIFYQPYLWWGQMKRRLDEPSSAKEGLLLPDTEIVIDGFQGSANSFATAAFKMSQTRPVKLMHHRHAPTMIIQALELGIPVVLTIREPEKAVISLTRRWPHVSVAQALRSYIGFYSKLEPYASQCIISTFALTTQHLDRVIQTVNTRFNTDFDLVNVNQANLARLQNISEKTDKARTIKKIKMNELDNLEDSSLLASANSLYQRYEEISQKALNL